MVELINPNGTVVDVAESAVRRELAAGWSHLVAPPVETPKPAPKKKAPVAPKKKSSGKSGKEQESSSDEDSE